MSPMKVLASLNNSLANNNMVFYNGSISNISASISNATVSLTFFVGNVTFGDETSLNESTSFRAPPSTALGKQTRVCFVFVSLFMYSYVRALKTDMEQNNGFFSPENIIFYFLKKALQNNLCLFRQFNELIYKHRVDRFFRMNCLNLKR